ncbi:RidA family protein [Enterobacteriaceae bacterium H11S18]|uniref:RidA family protein n=1 Tax=Enterobacteriaceae TaxID=543 RepID=UPI001928262F|nr:MULTISPECIES: RidA family protein [Enterobacteriaceae]MCT4706548.1 RidA family protein [Dryocola clanedunensis]MCT4713362.1 RidA family protein [Dryocola clanedunensis]
MSDTTLNETPYHRLADLGITLPASPAPVANFSSHVIAGNLLFLSGQGPVHPDNTKHRGKVGREVTTEEAYQHARLTGINLLAVIHEALGDLGRVKQVVKLLGMVNADHEFKDHPKVINGCSDLMVNVFGKQGVHARSAVGFSSLPDQITVEIEAIVAFE